ncbi:MAG TPA: hypothetical protein VG013_23795 [Gemmataceae bacterium]|jgi:hypothetical protein|nr:hypothetical protein [Gemmataceae bacterium]
MQQVISLLVIGFVVLLALHFMRPPCNFWIVVRDERIDVRGRAVTGKASQIHDFFRQDLPGIHQARVEGYWDGRRLRLRFRGALSRAHQQRIRNFLVLTL